MYKIISLLFFVFSLNSFSYIPTPESLFRSGANQDFENSYMQISMLMENKDLKEIGEKIKTQDITKIGSRVYVRFRIYKRADGRYDLIQTIYSSGKMSAANLISVKLFRDLKGKINKALELKKDNQALFYSLLLSIFLNDSKIVFETLKAKNVPLMTNSDMINQEKKELLGKYVNYLHSVNRDESLKDVLESPLSPSNDEEKLKVKELKKQTFLSAENNPTSIEKEGDKFYWMVKAGGLTAKFDVNTHRMQDFRLMMEGERIFGLRLRTYLLFDGIHQAPKYLGLMLGPSRFYLQTLDFKTSKLSAKGFYKRYSQLRKIKRVPLDPEKNFYPNFIF